MLLYRVMDILIYRKTVCTIKIRITAEGHISVLINAAAPVQCHSAPPRGDDCGEIWVVQIITPFRPPTGA